jgi:hypothetical protein
MFSLALAVVLSGIATTGLSALAQTSPENDVQSKTVPGQIAPQLQNIGPHQFLVTTKSARAQLFFNKGMMLVYGFNYSEATWSFQEATRFDPECAMAYYGMALVLGLNINMAVSPESEPQAYDLIQKAIALKKTLRKENRLISRHWRCAIPRTKTPTAMNWIPLHGGHANQNSSKGNSSVRKLNSFHSH